MQNPRWPSLLYCLKCCSRDPLGKQRGGDGGTKQKYRKVQKNRELEPGTRERAESGRLLYLNQVKVTSSNTTDRACHCLHTTRRYRHKTDPGLYYSLYTPSTSDSVTTTRGYCIRSSLYGVFQNRIDLPVEIYRCCADVPHTTQQRYYNEAARQE